MGLDMKTKKKLSEETAKRYCTAAKKQKTKILDEFIATTGYNRKYAIHVLKNSAYVKVTHFNNVARQSVQVITKTRKKRNYEKYYDQDVQEHVIRLWIFSMYLCAKRLVPFIRDNIDYFAQKFGYDENLKAIVLAAAKPALEQLSTMRCREGDIIGADVCDRLGNMKSMIDLIDDRKQKAIDNYSRYLKERIQELLADTDLTINEDRFLQDVAMLADKTDITEEIVRFRSHVIQLKNTLAQSNSIGRKLDFIIQEMNREVNTMGSKASDATITDCVVQLKCELEKVREQIQNVE